MPLSWNDKVLQYKAAGFGDDEIALEQTRLRDEYSSAGFSHDEIDEEFGKTKPDTSGMFKYVKDNLKAHFEGGKIDAPDNSASLSLPGPVPQSIGIQRDQEGKVKKADSFLEAVEAGLQMSVAGLMVHGAPTTVMPEDAPMYMNIASQLATLMPDLPVMALGGAMGGIAGGGVGTAIAPGVGTAAGVTLGFGAGSMALPTAIRTMMMEHYEKGWSQNFGEFWGSLSATMIAASKDAAIGAATFGVGGAVGKGLAKTAAPMLAKTSATVASEIATMVTLGKAMEGEVPTLKDFTEAALLVGALHSVGPVSKKMFEVYKRTGIKPSEMAEHAQADPTVKQDFLSENNDIPKAYETMQDPKAAPKSVELPLDAQVVEPGPELTQEFSAEKVGLNTAAGEELTPPKETLASENPDTQAAYEAISSKIGTELKGEKVPFKDRLNLAWDHMYTNFVDKFNPIKNAVTALAEGKGVIAAADAYKLARIANGAGLAFTTMMKKETFDFATKQANGKALEDIVEPHRKEIGKFEAYLASRRAIELDAKGIKNTGFPIDAARLVVDDGKARFEQAAKEVTEFSNRVLEYVKDAGFLTDEAYDAVVSAHQNYVPLQRLFAEGDLIGGKSRQKPIRELKGVKSEDILTRPPLESIMENTAFFMRIAEKNRAVEALVSQAETSQAGKDLIKKVSDTYAPVKLKSKELLSVLNWNEINPADIEVVGFMKKSHDLTDNQFEVWRKGKREVYETTPELAKALKALDGDPMSSNIAMRLARGVAGVLRLSTSLTPDFILRNVFRDQISGTVFSEHGLTFFDTLASLGDLMKKDKSEAYWAWMKSGGASGAFMEIDRNYLQTEIFKLSKETGMMDRAWNVVSSPLHFLRAAGELTEQATRLAEFKKTTNGDYSYNKLVEGSFNSREVTVDFQRMGAQTSAFNAITAFQNVAIQGLDRGVRAVKDNPGKTLGKAGLLITTPSVILWAVNHDDERYKELPDWQKNMFWIMPLNKWEKADPNDDLSMYPPHLIRTDKDGIPEVNRGTILRFPKPQELGLVFGSSIERALDALMTDQPHIGKHFARSVLDQFTPAMMPNILTPFAETYSNKNMFTGNPIVPGSVEKLAPEYRYTDYTSETAKKLSSLIATIPGASDIDAIAPAVIDNWIQSWTGNMGNYAVQTADALGKYAGVLPDTGPDKTLADIPFVKAFVVRHPSSGTQVMQDFYEEFNKYDTAFKTIRELAKRGELEASEKELAKIDDLDYAQNIVGAGDAVANLRRSLHGVYHNPDMTGAEKRQQVDGLYYMMNEIAKSKIKR